MEYKTISKVSLNTLRIGVFVVMALLTGWAVSHGDSTLSTSSFRHNLALVINALMLVEYLLVLYRGKVHVSVACLIPVCYYAVAYFDSYDAGDFAVLSLLKLMLVFLLNEDVQANIYIVYRKCIVVMAAAGIIAYVLYFLHIPGLYSIVEYYGQLGGSYINYHFAYLYQDSTILRLCGLFNEPGYLGTVIALILCIEKLDFKKKGNIILLIAGFLTISLAFYMVIILYMILQAYKKPKHMVFLLVLFFVLFFVLPNIQFSNPALMRFANRLNFANGGLTGDNRSNIYVDTALFSMIKSSAYWGFGGGYSSENFKAVSTFKTYLIDYGFLGFAIIYGPLIVRALYRSRKNVAAMCYTICFFVSVYQRPNIYTILYFLLIECGISYLLVDRNSRTNEWEMKTS